MLKRVKGNLLHADVEALVNAVNCIGYMGKGIALQFKQQFPENFRAYQKACKEGKIKPGEIFVFETNFLIRPKYLLNFPTKRHWRDNSKVEDIQLGLTSLVNLIKHLHVKSIAIPALGCGLGGLSWEQICPLIESFFVDLEDVQVLVFEPDQNIPLVNIW